MVTISNYDIDQTAKLQEAVQVIPKNLALTGSLELKGFTVETAGRNQQACVFIKSYGSFLISTYIKPPSTEIYEYEIDTSVFSKLHEGNVQQSPLAQLKATLESKSNWVACDLAHKVIDIDTSVSFLENIPSKKLILEITTGQITSRLEKAETIVVDPLGVDHARYSILQSEFKKELDKSNVGPKEDIYEVFELMAHELSKIDFSESLVEITPSESVKFTLLFSDDKMVMVSKSFRQFEDQPSGHVVIFSFFINRKLIVSDAAEIDDFVKGLKKYLSS